jgi:glycosyltransferase involved in cell wall biosynthesis
MKLRAGEKYRAQPIALHLMASLRASGMERMFVSSAECWNTSGWRTVIAGQGDEHPFADELLSAGLIVVEIPEVRTFSGVTSWVRLLREIRPDVVHIHPESMHGPIAVLTMFFAPRARVIRTVHSNFRFTGRARFTRSLQDIMFLLANGTTVSPSTDVQSNEQLYWGCESSVIENWVAEEFLRDAVPECPPEHDIIRLALIGNCSPIKNHQSVLQAALEVPGYEVTHVGSHVNAPAEELSLIQQLEASDSIQLLGTRIDVAQILAGVDVFTLPSKVEGMPVSLAEALCLGIPALIADSPGMTWAHDLPGVCVVRDERWSEALSEFRSDPAAFLALQQAARLGAVTARSRFTPQRGVNEYIAIYARPPRGRLRSLLDYSRATVARWFPRS